MSSTQPAMTGPPSGATVLVIQPGGGRTGFGLREVWEYRELLYFLVWRDLKVRYKQTVLGATWAVLQPFLTMVVFSVFFGRLAGVPSDGLPYPVFAYSALLPWQLFSNAVAATTTSVIGNQGLITKVYFPRLLVPITPVLSGLVDFGIAFAVLIGLLAYYGIMPGPECVAVPLLVVLAAATALTVGLWLSVLNVRYRDVRYALPFLIQLWLFVTPVAYPTALVPERWRVIYGLNPMVGVIEGFRWAMLGRGEPLDAAVMLPALLALVVLLVGGLRYFRRAQSAMIDLA